MIIEKTKTYRYEVLQAGKKPFMKFGFFRNVRESHNMRVQKTCFNCGHKFSDNEDVFLVIVKGHENPLLCEKCNDIALTDLKKGGAE